MTKLYVGNLPYSFNDDSLRDLFGSYTVSTATIIMDRATGRSKGFGFVEIDDDAAAQAAIAEMNGKDIEGRNIVVSVARPMAERPNRDNHDRGFRRERRY